jgi:type I restriction enzyme M protein
MPSNIFATTGTNVSILFIDKQNTGKVVLVDASKLGKKVKEGKNQKTLLSHEEEQKIIDAFTNKAVVEDFSVLLEYDEIKAKNYSFSAGQYFDIKIEYVDITAEEFASKMSAHKAALSDMFKQSHALEQDIMEKLGELKFEESSSLDSKPTKRAK